MGNAVICRGKGHAEYATVLRGNGTVLTFHSPMRVADLLQGYPGHFVCHSSSLLLMHEGKMLPGDTVLTPGETYFLFPIPKIQPDGGDLATSSQRHRDDTPQQGSGTMKFAVSNEMFSSILSGSMRENSVSKSRRRTKESTPFLERLKTWHPRSSNVAEVTTK